MVNVIGLGYIGLPTALMMASHGVEVIGTDYNKELVATLNAGKTTFKEKGLDELFQNALAAGVKFTTEYQVTDTYIVSVPTPYDNQHCIHDFYKPQNQVVSKPRHDFSSIFSACFTCRVLIQQFPQFICLFGA